MPPKRIILRQHSVSVLYKRFSNWSTKTRVAEENLRKQKITNNRNILSRIIDVIKFLCNLGFRGQALYLVPSSGGG